MGYSGHAGRWRYTSDNESHSLVDWVIQRLCSGLVGAAVGQRGPPGVAVVVGARLLRGVTAPVVRLAAAAREHVAEPQPANCTRLTDQPQEVVQQFVLNVECQHPYIGNWQ